MSLGRIPLKVHARMEHVTILLLSDLYITFHMSLYEIGGLQRYSQGHLDLYGGPYYGAVEEEK